LDFPVLSPFFSDFFPFFQNFFECLECAFVVAVVEVSDFFDLLVFAETGRARAKATARVNITVNNFFME
jgi:hypothetical protein